MRARNSNSPLLPVNSKHLKGKPGSSQGWRLVLLCIILFVVGYAFVSSGSQSNPRPHAAPHASPEHKLTIKEQMEHRSLSGEVVNTPPGPQLLHEDSGKPEAHHHIDELLASPRATGDVPKIHFDHTHRDGHRHNHHHTHHHYQHADGDHTAHPDATHQLAGRDAHPTGIPDAAHQVDSGHADSVNMAFPDATHQVVEAKGNGAGATGDTPKTLDDVKFINHDKWDEKDPKAPGTTGGTTTTTATTTKKEDEPVVAPAPASGTGLYALAALDIDGNIKQLREYQGKVTLVVNVASACGYTDSNYKGLQALYNKYRSRGLVVLGFPCNQFGSQESGTLTEIKAFCSGHYHVTFPMFSKVEVNGANTHPVYKFLKRELPASEGGGGGHGDGKDLTWNFNKYLVDPQGKPIRYYDSTFNQEHLERDIETLLLQVHN